MVIALPVGVAVQRSAIRKVCNSFRPQCVLVLCRNEDFLFLCIINGCWVPSVRGDCEHAKDLSRKQSELSQNQQDRGVPIR